MRKGMLFGVFMFAIIWLWLVLSDVKVRAQSDVRSLEIPAGYSYLGFQAGSEGFVIAMQKGSELTQDQETYFIDIKSDGTVTKYIVKEAK